MNDTNSGDDIGGIIESIGDDVYEFKPGDRVAAFHTMTKPAGSFAEYAVAEAHTTFHIPKKTSFEGRLALIDNDCIASLTTAQRLLPSLLQH